MKNTLNNVSDNKGKKKKRMKEEEEKRKKEVFFQSLIGLFRQEFPEAKISGSRGKKFFSPPVHKMCIHPLTS